MESVSLFAAFTGGIISFVSPCVLPLVPAYLSFLSGLSLSEIQESADRSRIIRRTSISALVFVAGFSLVFIAMGASATFIGHFLLNHRVWLERIAGVLVFVLGIHFLGIYRIRLLDVERRFQGGNRRASLFSVFVIGLAFAFGWTPCIGPILAGILTIAATQHSVGQGVVLLGVYSAGLGLPFLLVAVATNTFLNVFGAVKRHFRVVEMCAGLFLIVIGVLIFFDYFTVLSGYFAQWFPWLSTIG